MQGKGLCPSAPESGKVEAGRGFRTALQAASEGQGELAQQLKARRNKAAATTLESEHRADDRANDRYQLRETGDQAQNDIELDAQRP